MHFNRLIVVLFAMILASSTASKALAEQYASEKPFAKVRPSGYRYNPYSYLVDLRETRALAYLNDVTPEARRDAVTPELELRDYVYRSPYLPLQSNYKPYQKPLAKPWVSNIPYSNYRPYYPIKPTTPSVPGSLPR